MPILRDDFNDGLVELRLNQCIDGNFAQGHALHSLQHMSIGIANMSIKIQIKLVFLVGDNWSPCSTSPHPLGYL